MYILIKNFSKINFLQALDKSRDDNGVDMRWIYFTPNPDP